MQAQYTRLKKMEPRPGVKYSTTYVIMPPLARNQLQSQISSVLEQIVSVIDADPDLAHWFENARLKNFPTKTGGHRTALTVVTELLNEFLAKKPDGSPKDIALAPIDRWNRLFENTEWEIDLEPV